MSKAEFKTEPGQLEIEIRTQDWIKSFLSRLAYLNASELSVVENFLQERARVIEIKGKKVVLIDYEFDERKQGIELEALVADLHNRGVVIEYFAPELKHNARKAPIFIKPILRSCLNDPRYKKRLFGFNSLVRMCRQHQKDVFVSDIANNWNYQFERDITPLIGLIIPLLATYGVHFLVGGVLFFVSLYIRNAEKVSTMEVTDVNAVEKLVLYLEDARRIFVTAGFKKITQNMIKNSQPDDYIVSFYPRAHNNRFIEYAEYPNHLKALLYKLRYPHLSFSVRRFSFQQDAKPNKRGEQQLYDGWTLTDEVKI